MIYAIPHDGDRVANHFMKADQFAFIDGDNTLIKDVASPAAGDSSCSDKSAAINVIKEMNVDAVIIRNIGERSLGKLLNAGIRVFQVAGRTSLSQAINSPLTELTNASEGRPSTNHEKKGGCSHDHSHQQNDHIGLSAFQGQAVNVQGSGLQMRRGHRAMTAPVNAISSIRPVKK